MLKINILIFYILKNKMMSNKKIIIVSTTTIVLSIIIISLIIYFSLKKSPSPTPSPTPTPTPTPTPSSSPSRGINLENRTVLSIDPNIDSSNNLPKSWPYTDDDDVVIENQQPLNLYRTFSFSGERNQSWVKWLIKNEYFIFIGFDLSDNDEDINELINFYKIEKEKMDKYIIGLSIGNEPLTSEITKIKTKIAKIKLAIIENKLMKTPVTTVFSLMDSDDKEWIKQGTSYPPSEGEFSSSFLELIDDFDIIAFNLYGGFFTQRQLVEDFQSFDSALNACLSFEPGVSIIVNQIAVLRAAMSKANLSDDFPLIVAETGWSSAQLLRDGEILRDADGFPQTTKEWSNIINQRKFYDNFLKFDMVNNVKFTISQFPTVEYDFKPPNFMFFFCLRDSFLERENVQEFFGLYTGDLNSLQQKEI
jgi:hypothetical protein